MTGTTVSAGPNGTTPPRRRWTDRALASGLILAALLRYGWRLEAEPPFADEWAYYSQSWYGPLWWEGRWNDPAWVAYAAIDLPPLPKYAIAFSLLAEGKRLPPRAATGAWYEDINRTFGTIGDLTIARRPTIAFGVLAVVSIYAIGRTAIDTRAGLVAAALLLVNPLFTTLGRRAMSDVPAESLSLASLAIGLAAWKRITTSRHPPSAIRPLEAAVLNLESALCPLPSAPPSPLPPGEGARRAGEGPSAPSPLPPGEGARRAGEGPSSAIRHPPSAIPSPHPWLAWIFLSGVLAGAAVLAKLSGGLALMTLAAWALLAALTTRIPLLSRAGLIAATGAAALVAFVAFALGNPLLLSDPRLPAKAPEGSKQLATQDIPDRTRSIIEHRFSVSRGQQDSKDFASYALRTPLEKAQVIAVQGFGRFGPFGPRATDSTRRFDRAQDWGAILWLPITAAGFTACIRRGRIDHRAGRPPLPWALGLQALVALFTVGAFLPLAWDRYHISLQPVASLMAAVAAVSVLDAIARRLAPTRAAAQEAPTEPVLIP